MKKRLLLVDDDDLLRDALKQNLEKFGYDVIVAANGKIARDILDQQPIDLVVSDIRMPEMDGIELTRYLKQHFSIPIILITGFSDIIETQEAHSLGADDFLAKPFERDDLLKAIEKCLNLKSQNQTSEKSDYCKIGIEDFVSGRQIRFNIFIRLSEKKYVKIAHQGEDLALERVRAYKSKGVYYLYLRQEDFRDYVGFSLSLTKAVQSNQAVSQEKKINLLRHTGEILLERIHQDKLDKEMADGAATFVEATVGILSDETGIFNLLESLNSHTDYHYAHSVSVSFYGVMIAREVGWNLPTNKFKVAMGGLLHDVGEKEIGSDLLTRPRHEWSVTEVKAFESHPLRGVEILSQIKSIPADVIRVVKEHHEDNLAQGYPSRLKKTFTHPMAKLIAVSDAFCERVLRNADNSQMSPHEALEHMSAFCSDRLESQFFKALMRIFNFTPSPRSTN